MVARPAALAPSVAVRSPALAKLTRPKLYDALPRPRLFSLLDEAATRPIVWICAPPGSGKTTLVASYLEDRDLRHVWYQADIGDADPATFVHYMRTAASMVAGKAAALRCTAKEAETILGSRHLEAQELQRIQKQTEGWVAALVLLREHLSRRGATLDESLGEGKDDIFQYFAGEIFSGAKPENQRILMLTAIPPSITPSDAIALTGNDQAPRLLEYLYRRHLFTDRRRGDETSYHYHALFREFLLDELRNRLPSAERRTASARAAELLAARGQVSEALSLFRDAGELADRVRTTAGWCAGERSRP